MRPTLASAPATTSRARPSPRLPAGGGTTILLCDRNEDVHAMYGAALEHRGFAVLHASSVLASLRLLRSQPVSAVVVGVGTGGMFSRRAYLHLARAARSASCALLCLTTDPRLHAAARRRRCTDAVLMLPCKPEALAAEVVRVIGEARGRPN